MAKKHNITIPKTNQGRVEKTTRETANGSRSADASKKANPYDTKTLTELFEGGMVEKIVFQARKLDSANLPLNVTGIEDKDPLRGKHEFVAPNFVGNRLASFLEHAAGKLTNKPALQTFFERTANVVQSCREELQPLMDKTSHLAYLNDDESPYVALMERLNQTGFRSLIMSESEGWTMQLSGIQEGLQKINEKTVRHFDGLFMFLHGEFSKLVKALTERFVRKLHPNTKLSSNTPTEPKQTLRLSSSLIHSETASSETGLCVLKAVTQFVFDILERDFSSKSEFDVETWDTTSKRYITDHFLGADCDLVRALSVQEGDSVTDLHAFQLALILYTVEAQGCSQGHEGFELHREVSAALASLESYKNADTEMTDLFHMYLQRMRETIAEASVGIQSETAFEMDSHGFCFFVYWMLSRTIPGGKHYDSQLMTFRRNDETNKKKNKLDRELMHVALTACSLKFTASSQSKGARPFVTLNSATLPKHIVRAFEEHKNMFKQMNTKYVCDPRGTSVVCETRELKPHKLFTKGDVCLHDLVEKVWWYLSEKKAVVSEQAS